MEPLAEKESSHLQILGAVCLLENTYGNAASKSSLKGFTKGLEDAKDKKKKKKLSKMCEKTFLICTSLEKLFIKK